MSNLPAQVAFSSPAGSQWAQAFRMQGVDITGLAWEFVIRPTVVDRADPPLVRVTSTINAQGQITVDTSTGAVQVVLTSAATKALGRGPKRYALWSNPGTPSQTCWCEGVFTALSVSAA
ncbi:hypothetical protein ACIGMX_34505 [Streptomyces aquilus]|uniref:hypothetical protein n=1 Tax=Streptomyces aquilus TaxID=2548456 RepID=UPI0037D4F058